MSFTLSMIVTFTGLVLIVTGMVVEKSGMISGYTFVGIMLAALGMQFAGDKNGKVNVWETVSSAWSFLKRYSNKKEMYGLGKVLVTIYVTVPFVPLATIFAAFLIVGMPILVFEWVFMGENPTDLNRLHEVTVGPFPMPDTPFEIFGLILYIGYVFFGVIRLIAVPIKGALIAGVILALLYVGGLYRDVSDRQIQEYEKYKKDCPYAITMLENRGLVLNDYGFLRTNNLLSHFEYVCKENRDTESYSEG